MRRKAELSPEVMVIRHSSLWRYVRLPFAVVVQKALAADGYKGSAQVAVVLTDDAAIQALNHQFRGKNAPTNVLSFPSDEPGELGDIILSYETIVAEAEAQQKPLKSHTTHMLVHGALHLLGYDHMTDMQAEEMEAIEISVLAQLGIENPYQLR